MSNIFLKIKKDNYTKYQNVELALYVHFCLQFKNFKESLMYGNIFQNMKYLYTVYDEYYVQNCLQYCNPIVKELIPGYILSIF